MNSAKRQVQNGPAEWRLRTLADELADCAESLRRRIATIYPNGDGGRAAHLAAVRRWHAAVTEITRLIDAGRLLLTPEP